MPNIEIVQMLKCTFILGLLQESLHKGIKSRYSVNQTAINIAFTIVGVSMSQHKLNTRSICVQNCKALILDSLI